ncbi:MAG: hypothetical protein RL686_2152, partial [Pseudomonadota bacterium]
MLPKMMALVQTPKALQALAET